MFDTKIILFGGTFDPVHLGHTTVVGHAVESIGAEKVIFIPAKRSPLKAFFPLASDAERYEMIKLAITDKTGFEVSDYELKKASPSYTIDTVKHFKGLFGHADIYWLVGADTLSELPHWFGIEELIDACNLSVMYRGGFEKPDFEQFIDSWGQGRVDKLKANIVETPMIDISSTEIRKRLMVGGDACDMVCPAVAEYICEQGLYGSEVK